MHLVSSGSTHSQPYRITHPGTPAVLNNELVENPQDGESRLTLPLPATLVVLEVV